MTSRRGFLRTCLGSIAAVAMAVYVPRLVVEQGVDEELGCFYPLPSNECQFWQSGELPAHEMSLEDYQCVFDNLTIKRPPEPLIVTHESYVLLGGNR